MFCWILPQFPKSSIYLLLEDVGQCPELNWRGLVWKGVKAFTALSNRQCTQAMVGHEIQNTKLGELTALNANKKNGIKGSTRSFTAHSPLPNGDCALNQWSHG